MPSALCYTAVLAANVAISAYVYRARQTRRAAAAKHRAAFVERLGSIIDCADAENDFHTVWSLRCIRQDVRHLDSAYLSAFGEDYAAKIELQAGLLDTGDKSMSVKASVRQLAVDVLEEMYWG